jgi:capsular polysaccharide biosynthesis protein
MTGHITPSWEFSPKSRKWVGEKIRDGLNETSGSERIFVSREGLNKRSIQNLDQIKPVLESFSIKIIDPRSMSFHDQVSLYANSELLIGPSGSGLHNMMFSDVTTVMEIFHPDYVTTYNYRLAESFGHEYRFILGSETNSDQRRPVKDRCFTVSPAALESALESWVADF